MRLFNTSTCRQDEASETTTWKCCTIRTNGQFEKLMKTIRKQVRFFLLSPRSFGLFSFPLWLVLQHTIIFWRSFFSTIAYVYIYYARVPVDVLSGRRFFFKTKRDVALADCREIARTAGVCARHCHCTRSRKHWPTEQVRTTYWKERNAQPFFRRMLRLISKFRVYRFCGICPVLSHPSRLVAIMNRDVLRWTIPSLCLRNAGLSRFSRKFRPFQNVSTPLVAMYIFVLAYLRTLNLRLSFF